MEISWQRQINRTACLKSLWNKSSNAPEGAIVYKTIWKEVTKLQRVPFSSVIEQESAS